MSTTHSPSASAMFAPQGISGLSRPRREFRRRLSLTWPWARMAERSVALARSLSDDSKESV
eukprot:13327071-Heterocapsa_arctica.AAC.1